MEKQTHFNLTGIPSLDGELGPITAPTLIKIAGRTSMGKTSFALQCAVHVAKREGRPCLFLSNESEPIMLSNKVLSQQTEINQTRCHTGKLNDEEWSIVKDLLSSFQNVKMRIKNPHLRFSVATIREEIKEFCSENGPGGLIVIDSFILWDGEYQLGTDKEQEFCRELRQIATEFDCSLLLVVFLDCWDGEPESLHPSYSNPNDDADIILMLHNKEYYHRSDSSIFMQTDVYTIDETEVVIVKNRTRPPATVKVAFRCDWTKFMDMREGISSGWTKEALDELSEEQIRERLEWLVRLEGQARIVAFGAKELSKTSKNKGFWVNTQDMKALIDIYDAAPKDF